MPIYQIRNKTTGEIERSELMTIGEGEQFEKDNPNYELACGAPIPGYNIYSIKPDGDLRDRLKAIKDSHPGSTIDI